MTWIALIPRVDNFPMGIGFIVAILGVKSNMIVRIILMYYVALQVTGKDETLIGCYSPQYLEIGTDGVIQCQFPTDFRAVYWFDNVTEENIEPILSYKDSIRDGPGYHRGEFDIFPNGSLIIKGISLLHEKTFKVVCFGADDLYNLFHISVIVTVPPIQEHPQISRCEGSSELCLTREHKNNILSCRINASRPASIVEWFVQLGEEYKLVNSSKTIYVNPDSTFNTVARLNLSIFGDNVVAMLYCGSKQEHIGNWKYKPVLIEFLQNQSLVSDLLTPVYVPINGLATLLCPLHSTNHIHQVVLWTKNLVNRDEDIALWTMADQKTTKIFNSEYSVGADGSLVVNSVKLHHEGNYTCIASSYATSDTVKSFHLVVLVSPVPPYITVHECPTLGTCTVLSSAKGKVTCTVSGVRPLVTFQWATRDDSQIYFQNEETTIKEHDGLFSVSSTMHYKLTTDTECVGISFVSCSAHGITALTFLSVRELEIRNVNCSREPTDKTDSPTGSLSTAMIAVIVILGIVTVGIVCTCLAKLLLKQYHTPMETMGEDTTVQLLHLDKDNRRQKLINELKMTYEELLANWPTSQWKSDFGALEKDVYIPNDLSMKVEQKISSKHNSSALSHKDLFEKEDLKDKHILIEGGPGQGKTSFIMHLLEKWIKSDNESTLKKFDILIMFSLKDMRKGQSFFDMIVDKLLATDSDFTNEEIENLLKEEDRYLLLLDDFEQYPEKHENESALHNIIRRKCMRNTKVILLTRSTFSTKTLGKGIVFLTLQDFTTSQISEYLDRFFEKGQEHFGERLKSKFQEDGNIALMCRTPLFLFMFASIFLKTQHGKEKLDSITTLFDKLLSFTYSLFGETTTTEVDFERSYGPQHPKGIAKLAMDGLKSSHSSWSKNDLSGIADDQYVEAMNKLGVLKEVEKTSKSLHGYKKQTNVKFSHDLYQYFYAAVYLASSLQVSEFENYLESVDAYTCQPLFVFTCGLSEKKDTVEKIVRYLLTKNDRYPFPIRDCIIQCLTEVTCDDWGNRIELLEDLCKKEYSLSIRENDSTRMKNAKAFLINICSKQSIPFNVLGLCEVLQKIDGSSVSLDSGTTLELPKSIKLISLTDFKEIVRENDVMFLIENTVNLTEIFVYSSLLPSSCTQEGLDIMRKRKVTAVWITFENGSVVAVSFPSVCHGVWLSLEEVVTILYMRFFKGWNDLPEEERRNKEQNVLTEIKEKGLKEFLEKSEEFSTMECSLLLQLSAQTVQTMEELINEWFWIYEATNDETAEEHSQKFTKLVEQLQETLKLLQNFLPNTNFSLERFQQIDVNDIQCLKEDKMIISSVTLKNICHMLQL